MRSVLPILAAASLALSTAACQNMPWSKDKGTSGQQTSAAPAATVEEKALSADFIRDIQRRLSQRGYDAGPVDGIYGDTTQQAMRKFQRDQSLRSSGQVDEQSLAALGMAGGRGNAAGPQRSELPGSYQPMERR